MRYMGIDYGTRRVGVALSDEGGVMAFPHAVIENSETLLHDVLKLIERERVSHIVIGTSIDHEGRENAVQKDIDAFTMKLREASPVPISQEGERYTTQEALRTQGRTEMTDASAAALILDTHLTRLKRAP